MSSREIFWPDCSAQSIIRVVRPTYRVVFGVEGNDPAARTENLLPHDGRIMSEAGPDCGFDPEPARRRGIDVGYPAARNGDCPFGDRPLIISEHFLPMFFEIGRASCRERVCQYV